MIFTERNQVWCCACEKPVERASIVHDPVLLRVEIVGTCHGETDILPISREVALGSHLHFKLFDRAAA
jgi:hypothetical protein